MAEAAENPTTQPLPATTPSAALQPVDDNVPEGGPSNSQQGTIQQNAPKEGEEATEPPNLFGSWVFWALALFWVYWIWSMSRKRKTQGAEADRLKNLAKGDMVVTIGRMHGTVVAFTEDTVTIRPDDKAPLTMTFDRVAIYRVVPKPGDPTADGATR